MDVNVMLGEKILVNLEVLDVAPDVTEGSLGRFLHDLSQGAGEDQLIISFHLSGLNKNDIPTCFSPDQSSGNSDPIFGLGNLVVKFPWPEIFLHQLGSDHQSFLLSSLLQNFSSDLAANGTDLPLQVSQASLPGVFSDNFQHGL
jgi:hypothetical protein